MPAREGAAKFARFSVYAAAYGAVILTFALVWARYKYELYLPRDGEYNLWLAQTYRDWANAWDITSFNPLQGMTSMLVAINPYFNPGHWAFFTGLPAGVAIIASYCIYVLELLVSTFLLGRALGFSPTFSYAASLWTSLLLAPPFNYTFGFLGWLSVAPMYGHALALSNLLAVVFIRLGDAGPRSAIRNPVFVLCFVALFVMLLLGGPFYYAGMVPGIALLLGCIFISSNRWRQIVWRLAAGATLGLVLYLLGVFEFLGSSRVYSDRFTESAMLRLNLPAQIAWPAEEAMSRAYMILCAWGLVCVPFPGRPLAVGSYWMHAAVIAGGILVYRKMPLPASRVGLCLGRWSWLFGWLQVLGW